MGYTIPGADYTIGPSGIGQIIANTGKNIASSLNAGFAQRQRNKEAADKIKMEQSKVRSQWMKDFSAKKKDFQTNLQAAGLQDTEGTNDLFDQYSNKIDEFANTALEANQALTFGDFNSDDKIKMPVGFMGNTEEKMYSRSELADKVTFFDTYTSTGQQQLGELLADTDMLNDPTLISNALVTGNQTNGEAFINELALKNIGVGGDGSLLGENVKSSRTLIEEKGRNIIQSTVKVPKNSSLLKDAQSQVNALLENPLEGFKEEDGFYVFTSKIDLTGYGTKDGMDLVVTALDTLPASQTMIDSGIFNEEGAFRDTYIDTTTQTITVPQEAPTKDRAGKESVTKLNIVNMGKVRTNPDLMKKINSAYVGIFEDPSVTESQRDRYLLDIGIPMSYEELKKQETEFVKNEKAEGRGFEASLLAPEELTKGYIIDVMTSGIIDQFVEDVNYEGTKRFNAKTLEEGSDLLKYVQENPNKVGSYMEVGQEPRPYQAGDTIYFLNTTSINTVAKLSGDGTGTEQERLNKATYDELVNFDAANPGRFTSPSGIDIPGSSGKFRYFPGEGFYYIDKEGSKVGSKITNPENLFQVANK